MLFKLVTLLTLFSGVNSYVYDDFYNLVITNDDTYEHEYSEDFSRHYKFDKTSEELTYQEWVFSNHNKNEYIHIKFNHDLEKDMMKVLNKPYELEKCINEVYGSNNVNDYWKCLTDFLFSHNY